MRNKKFYEVILNNSRKARIYHEEVQDFLRGLYTKRKLVFFTSLTQEEAEEAIEKILHSNAEDFI